MTYRGLLVAGVALSAITLAAMPASAKELKNIGMSVGSMSNPYFIALAEGATNAAKKINPDAKLTVVSSEYDLGKQFSQMDNFIAAGVDLILVAADDPHAIAPAVKRAQDAGIPVIAVDVEAEGANATIETDNYQAGLVSCAYLGEKMGGGGDVVMQWVGPLSGSIARIKGCHDALGKYPNIKVVSDDENSGCTREGGLKFTLGDLQRFPNLKGMYTICEPEALGANLAIKQLGRSGIVVTSTDGSPDAADALKTDTALIATSSQDPREEGRLGIEEGYAIMNGKEPETKVLKLSPKLVTRDNVSQYTGW
jgi:ribose transport system substrate-binding protein